MKVTTRAIKGAHFTDTFFNIHYLLSSCGKGDDFFLCRFVVVQFSGDLTFVDNEDAVAHADNFRQFGGDHDDGDALRGQFVHEIVDVALGADVDAACRFIHDDDGGVHADPFGDDDLLLIAA